MTLPICARSRSPLFFFLWVLHLKLAVLISAIHQPRLLLAIGLLNILSCFSWCCCYWLAMICSSLQPTYTVSWPLALRMVEVTQVKINLQANSNTVLNTNDMDLICRRVCNWSYCQNIMTLAQPSLFSFLLFLIPCKSWMMVLRINHPQRAYQHEHYNGKRASVCS